MLVLVLIRILNPNSPHLFDFSDITRSERISDNSEIDMELFGDINLPIYSQSDNENLWLQRENKFGNLEQSGLENVIVPDRNYINPELVGTRANSSTIVTEQPNANLTTRLGRVIRKPDFYQSTIFRLIPLGEF